MALQPFSLREAGGAGLSDADLAAPAEAALAHPLHVPIGKGEARAAAVPVARHRVARLVTVDIIVIPDVRSDAVAVLAAPTVLIGLHLRSRRLPGLDLYHLTDRHNLSRPRD